jgi:hypothetical protein
MTGESKFEPAPIFEEDWPYRGVAPEQSLLRYMDFSKFEDLFITQELYFRRSDKFTDLLEGTLSAEGIHGTSASDVAAKEKCSLYGGIYEVLSEEQKIARECTFVNCWHINDRDTERMWNSYTTSYDSLLIVSSLDRLQRSLRSEVFMAAVKYVTPETPRTIFGLRSLFYYKDSSYSFEQEFRLLVDLLILGGSVEVDNEHDYFRRVPVNLSMLVGMIIPHPCASQETKNRIEALVRQYLPNAEIVGADCPVPYRRTLAV